MDNTSVLSNITPMQHGKHRVAFRWITPEEANRILSTNDKNRSLNLRNVEKLAEEMAEGRWEFDGATIKISEAGKLLDGQHRLTAVVRYGHPVLFLVVSGLSESSQDVMDTGRKRSAADMFNIHGKQYALQIASVARLVCGWNSGQIKNSGSMVHGLMSNALIRDTVATDSMIEWAAKRASRWSHQIPATPSAIGFAAWLCGNVDPAATDEFFDSIAEHRTNGQGDPRYTLIKRLASARDRDEKLSPVEQTFFMVRAWNAWRSGSDLRNLKATTAAGPVDFPVAS